MKNLNSMFVNENENVNESFKSAFLRGMAKSGKKYPGNAEIITWLNSVGYALSDITDKDFAEVTGDSEGVRKAIKTYKNILAIDKNGEVVLFVAGSELRVNKFNKKRIGPLMNSLHKWDSKLYTFKTSWTLKKKEKSGKKYEKFDEKAFFAEAKKNRAPKSALYKFVKAIDAVVKKEGITAKDLENTSIAVKVIKAAEPFFKTYWGNDVAVRGVKVKGSAEHDIQWEVKFNEAQKMYNSDDVRVDTFKIESDYSTVRFVSRGGMNLEKTIGHRGNTMTGELVSSIISNLDIHIEGMEVGKSKRIYNSDLDRYFAKDKNLRKILQNPKNISKSDAKFGSTGYKDKWDSVEEFIAWTKESAMKDIATRLEKSLIFISAKKLDTAYVLTTEEEYKFVSNIKLAKNTFILKGAISDNDKAASYRSGYTYDLMDIPSNLINDDMFVFSISSNSRGQRNDSTHTFSQWFDKTANYTDLDNKKTNEVIVQNKYNEQRAEAVVFIKQYLTGLEKQLQTKFPEAAIEASKTNWHRDRLVRAAKELAELFSLTGADFDDLQLK